MTRKASIMIGSLTTLLLVGIGAAFLAEEAWLIGGACLAFGLFRGFLVMRQVAAHRAEDEEHEGP